MMTNPQDIPNIEHIAKEFVRMSEVSNMAHDKGDIDMADVFDCKIEGILFTLLVVLGCSTMAGSRNWMREELKKIAKNA